MADRGKIWDILNFFAGDAGRAVDAAKNSDTDAEYLAQRRARGLGDSAFGMFDVGPMVANAAIGDVDFWTSGGLSGGTYDPFQFGMPSQHIANFLTDITGTDIIPASAVSPAVQQKGANQQALFGMIPTDVTDIGTLAVGGGKAVLHGMPNLFKKPALEDLAKGVDPDKVWHDWQWEQNAAGQPQTETIGAPRMNENVVEAAGNILPPRGSDFEPSTLDQNQPALFTEREMADPGGPPRRNIPMAYDPTEPLSPYDPRVRPKYPWRGGTVSDFVENPSLYEQPGLEFLGGLPMSVKSGDLPENTRAGGLYHHPDEANPQGRISLAMKSANPVSVAQHEMTHAAAQEFGLPQGYSWLSPDAGPKGAQIRAIMEGDNRAYEDVVNQRRADYWRHEDEMFDKYGDLKSTDFDESGKTIYRPGEMSLTDFNKRWGEQNPMMQKVLEEGRNLSDFTGGTSDEMLAYHTSMGEVAARNAALRDTSMSPQELRQKRPAKTEDVPRKYQWTTDKKTGASSASDDLVPAVKEAQQRLRLYHGSPYEFDTFDVSKQGIGEGGANNGRGVNLTDDMAEAITYQNPTGRWGIPDDIPDRFKNTGGGHLYETEIDASPEQFVDLDAPLNQQPQAVRDAVSEWSSKADRGDERKLSFYVREGRGVEDRLSQAGFKGFTANMGQNKHYTVFDPSSVSILSRNGEPLKAAADLVPAVKAAQKALKAPSVPATAKAPTPESVTAPGLFDIVPDDPRQVVSVKDAKNNRKDPEWYHPIGAGVRLRTPFSELTSETVPTGGVALPPQTQLRPEDLVGKVGLALLGDNTRAGETLTKVGDQLLPNPQELHGGYRFMDEFDGSVWASKSDAMKRIMDRMQEEARRGKEVVGLPVSMGAEGSDSARMMTDPALDLTNLEDMPPAMLEAFDNRMRFLTTDKRGRTSWPGLATAKKDHTWRMTAPGTDRAALVKAMSEGGFVDWFSHVPGLRKALAAPDLLNRPALTTGQSVGLFNSDGVLRSNPAKQHNTYDTQGAGTSLGRLGLLPYDAVFQKFGASRPPGEASPHTMRTMMTQVPEQVFDNEWLENFMRRVEGARE